MPISTKNRLCSGLLIIACMTAIPGVLGTALCEETGDYIHYRLGVKYKGEKRYDQALEEFRKVLAAYPDNYNAYMHLAEIRSMQARSRLVIYNLKKALTHNPGWGKAHKMLADAYEKDGQIQKAILELQTYQQSCDPAESDSLQNAISRLVAKVGVRSAPAATATIPTPAETKKGDAAIEERGRPDAPVTSVAAAPAAAPQKSLGVPAGEKPVAISAAPANPKAEEAFKRAVDLYNEKQYDESLRELRQVLKLQADHKGAFYYAGLIRHRNGQTKMAKINFAKAVSYPDLGVNAYFYLGQIFGTEKNYPEAIRNLTKYLSRAPSEEGRKQALVLLKSYRELAGTASGDSALSAAIAADSLIRPVPDQRYIVPIEIRIDSLLYMVVVDTLTDAGQKLLGGIKAFREGRFDEAIGEFKKVLAGSPTGNVAAHCLYNTGVCYFKLGLYKEAENQFQQVIDRFAALGLAAQCKFLKALTYLERGESSTAEKLFRAFIQSNRQHQWTGKAFEKLGDAYIDMEQPKKAIDAFGQAITQTSNRADQVCAHFKLGVAYSQVGNMPRSLSSFAAAIETGEKHDIFLRVPDSYYKIADARYQQKDYKGALEQYKRVTRKYPAFQETPWGLFQIGSIYKNLQQYRESVEVFKDLMKRFPEDYWAKQAQWKIDDAVWEHEYRAVLK